MIYDDYASPYRGYPLSPRLKTFPWRHPRAFNARIKLAISIFIGLFGKGLNLYTCTELVKSINRLERVNTF